MGVGICQQWLKDDRLTDWLMKDLGYSRARDAEEIKSLLQKRFNISKKTGSYKPGNFRIAKAHFHPASVLGKRATLLDKNPETGDPTRPNNPLRNFADLPTADLRGGRQRAQAPAAAVRQAPLDRAVQAAAKRLKEGVADDGSAAAGARRQRAADGAGQLLDQLHAKIKALEAESKDQSDRLAEQGRELRTVKQLLDQVNSEKTKLAADLASSSKEAKATVDRLGAQHYSSVHCFCSAAPPTQPLASAMLIDRRV